MDIVMVSPTKTVKDADLAVDKAVRSGAKHVWVCGMEMVDASIRGKDLGPVCAAALREAHRLHHDGLETLFVRAGQHDPTASFYFQETIAWCSCGYDPETDVSPE